MADCAIFVLWRDGQALMENRPDLGPGGDYLVYPGGKVRGGESHADAMVREALEEAGVRPTTFRRLSSADLWSSPNMHSPLDSRGWLSVPFLVTDWDGSPPSRSMDHQHAGYEWVDPRLIAGDHDASHTCRGAIARLLVQLGVDDG